MMSLKNGVFLISLVILLCDKGFCQDDYTDEDAPEQQITRVPKFTSTESEITINEKDTARLHCSVDNIEGFVIIWKKGSTILTVDTVKVVRDSRIKLKDSTLLITKAVAEDSGEYFCVISSDNGPEQKHVVTVLVPPAVLPIPENGKEIARKGESVSIGCNATGNPPPKITWSKDGEDMEEEGDIITFPNIQPDDAGNYTCTAVNSVDRATSFISLQVLYKPEVTVESEWVHSGLGETSDITCVVRAAPHAEVRWERGGKPMSTGGSSATRQNGPRYTLTIKNVQPADLDNYTCIAFNNLGHTDQTVQLSGLAKQVEFISDARGNRDSSYTIRFKVESFSPIINYRLFYRSEKTPNEDWFEVDVTPAQEGSGSTQEQSYELKDLTPSTYYQAKAIAENKYGWNKESETFRFHTLGAAVRSAIPETSDPNVDATSYRYGKMAADKTGSGHALHFKWTVVGLMLGTLYCTY